MAMEQEYAKQEYGEQEVANKEQPTVDLNTGIDSETGQLYGTKNKQQEQQPGRFRRGVNAVREGASRFANAFAPETEGEGAHQRNVGRLGVLRSVDRMFGSGRSAQGTIGQLDPLFQDQKADLQAAVDLENDRLRREMERGENVEDIHAETAAQAEANLQALTESGRAEQELQGIIDREQRGLEISNEERALLNAWRENGQQRQLEQAAQARADAFADTLTANRAQRDAFVQYGAELSRRMNQQQINNGLATLEQLTPEEQANAIEFQTRMAREMGGAEARAITARATHLYARYRAATSNVMRAFYRDQLEVGQMREFASNLFGGELGGRVREGVTRAGNAVGGLLPRRRRRRNP